MRILMMIAFDAIISGLSIRRCVVFVTCMLDGRVFARNDSVGGVRRYAGRIYRAVHKSTHKKLVMLGRKEVLGMPTTTYRGENHSSSE